jgi:hypothetical protein
MSVQTELTESVKKMEIYKKNLEGLSEESVFHIDFHLGHIYGLCIPNSCNVNMLLHSINKGMLFKFKKIKIIY